MGKKLTEEHKAKMAEGREKARLAKIADAAQSKHDPAPQVVAVPDGVEVKPLTAEPTIEQPSTAPSLNPSDNGSMTELVMQLMREVDDLKRANPNVNVTPDAAIETLAQLNGTSPSIGSQGVQGRVFKYPVEKSYYPDPTERLYNDERLKRFAMKENFYFKWDVEGETYEKYGITYTEPRFIVELYRYMFDEDGNPTGQMYLVNRQFQHEDELIARVVADRLGQTFDTHEALLNEMRFWRIHEWLMGVFTPQKVNAYQKKTTTMVVDGKVVEVTDTEDVIEQEKGIAAAQTLKYQTQVPRS
jgi:hypothetical protein